MLSNRGLTNTHTAIPTAHVRASLIPDYLFCRYTIKKLRFASKVASSLLIGVLLNASFAFWSVLKKKLVRSRSRLVGINHRTVKSWRQ